MANKPTSRGFLKIFSYDILSPHGKGSACMAHAVATAALWAFVDVISPYF